MYFPIYFAAERKYATRWEVLFVLRARETTLSTDTNRDGAMQIRSDFYSSQWREEALKNWEYLKLFKTRQRTDAREIMASGKYLVGRWGKRPKEGDWDVAAMDYYASIEDDKRMAMARELLGITRDK